MSAIILGMVLANGNWRYNVTLPLNGWANAKIISDFCAINTIVKIVLYEI